MTPKKRRKRRQMQRIFPKLIRKVVHRHGYRAVIHYETEDDKEADRK